VPAQCDPVLVHAGIALDEPRRGAAHVGEAVGGLRQKQCGEAVPDAASAVIRVLSVEQLTVPGRRARHGEARASGAGLDTLGWHLLLYGDLKQLRQEVAPQDHVRRQSRSLRDPTQLVEVDLGDEPPKRIEDLSVELRSHRPSMLLRELAQAGIELGVVSEERQHALVDLLSESLPVLASHLVAGALQGEDSQVALYPHCCIFHYLFLLRVIPAHEDSSPMGMFFRKAFAEQPVTPILSLAS